MRADGELTNEELVILAREASYTGFNQRRLAEAHRAGLLPRPRTDHPGGGGSASYYPAGTDTQLLALLAARATDRRNDEVAWHLWMDGYPISSEAIATRLTRAAEELDTVSVETRALLADPEKQESLLTEARDGELDGPALDARRLVGADAFTTLAYVAAQVVAGEFEQYEDAPYLLEGELSPEQIIEKGLRLEAARTHALPGAEPWLKDGTEGSLRDLAKIFRSASAGTALAVATPAELDEARRAVKALVSTIPAAAGLVERQHGEGAFGVGGWKRLEQLDADEEAKYICLLLVAQTQAVPLPGAADAESLGATIEMALADEAHASQLAAAIPSLAALLDPARVGEAMRTPGGAEALHDEIEQVATLHRAEIDTWLASSAEN